MRPLHSTSRWEPSWRKVRKQQRLWQRATKLDRILRGRRNTKLTLLRHSRYGMVHHVGPARELYARPGNAFEGFGEYLVDEVT